MKLLVHAQLKAVRMPNHSLLKFGMHDNMGCGLELYLSNYAQRPFVIM